MELVVSVAEAPEFTLVVAGMNVPLTLTPPWTVKVGWSQNGVSVEQSEPPLVGWLAMLKAGKAGPPENDVEM